MLKLHENRGKGYAVKAGMLHARGIYLLMVDADGATRIQDVENLEARLQDFERRALSRHGSANAIVDDELHAMGWIDAIPAVLVLVPSAALLASGLWLCGWMPGREALTLAMMLPVSGTVLMNLVCTRRKMWEDILVMELVVLIFSVAMTLLAGHLLRWTYAFHGVVAGASSASLAMLMLTSTSYESEQASVTDCKRTDYPFRPVHTLIVSHPSTVPLPTHRALAEWDCNWFTAVRHLATLGCSAAEPPGCGKSTVAEWVWPK
eukprot:SAG31_NODE_89_length_26711_cov_24.949459_23_plen_263_part_00